MRISSRCENLRAFRFKGSRVFLKRPLETLPRERVGTETTIIFSGIRSCLQTSKVARGVADHLQISANVRQIAFIFKKKITTAKLRQRLTFQNYGHYDDVIIGAIASQITSITIVYSTVYSGADQSKHQSSASLVFVWGIHRGPVNSLHKWPVTRKMFPFDDVIMVFWCM